MPSQTAFKSKWFDESTETPIIAEEARRLDSFLAAVADGPRGQPRGAGTGGAAGRR